MNTVDPKSLRKRLWISITTALIFTLTVTTSFLLVKNGPKIEGAPAFLRKVLVFNQKLWSSVYSGSRLSYSKKKPPSGTEPRINGDLGLEKEADLSHYQVSVESGDTHLSLPISAFQMLKKVGYSTDFKCIEGWSEVIQYAGGRFSDFMSQYQVGKKPDGSYYRYVGMETPDGQYYVSIDMDSMLHAQTVLAYEMNDEPLSDENGAPLRLIIPIKYGVKSIKRIGKISFSDTQPKDYWAEQGYDWWAGL